MTQHGNLSRRDFVAHSLVGTAGLAAAGAAAMAPTAAAAQESDTSSNAATFKMKYAPHLGMFRAHGGDDPVSQIDFMAAEGFRAFEDNGMRGRSVADQKRIAAALERNGMTMGVFVANAEFGKVTFASNDESVRRRLLDDMKASVEVAKRVNARWCTVVPGAYHRKLAWEFQTANCVDNLKRCAEVLEPAGLTMVLEPLNPHRDHPGLFLTKIPQAYMLCRAVGSPSCKILNDLYHQQITEGNLIPNIDHAWDEIPYYQVGDNPGRKEPTTGEINYRNIFRHLHKKGFDGVIGMEHGNSQPGKAGERAVIDAYRACDNF